jgi:hypothetical protein
MRRLFLGVVLALCATTVSAQAPWGARGSFPGCPDCGVWSWVDDPADQVTVSTRAFVIQGWGFECVSGRPVDRVDVWYQDYNGAWQPLKQAQEALAAGAVWRGDVVQFGPTVGCPNVAANTGWVLSVTGMPLGLRRVRIVAWKGPYFEAHTRTYLVVE